MMRFIHHRVLGVFFVGMMVLAVWFVYAIFTQKFSQYDKVTLHADNVGLQLPAKADVKARGVEVGEVLDVKAGKPGEGATITLGIDRDKIDQVPSVATASLLPKTLFGEKYVELDFPEGTPRKPSLHDGATIKQTQLPVEVEQVLNDIYPLLETVQPAQLNFTLNALATALEGRGAEIGESVGTLARYLNRINPQVPALVRDLRHLSAVSTTYADVMPEIAATLRNTVKTGNTLLSRQAKLHQFLQNATAFSNTARSFLDANGDNIIRLGQLSEPLAAMLKRYSPEVPCLLSGLNKIDQRFANAFRNYTLHVQLTLLPLQPRSYNSGDTPKLGDNTGPSCAGLPNPPGSPAHPYTAKNFKDGLDDNGGTLGRGDNQRTAPGFARRTAPAGGPATRPATGPAVVMGGTSEQKAMFNAIASPAMGAPADQLPDVTTLLFAPATAGTEVSLK